MCWSWTVLRVFSHAISPSPSAEDGSGNDAAVRFISACPVEDVFEQRSAQLLVMILQEAPTRVSAD